MSIALKGFSGQTGVGDELGKSGTVKLSELNTTHATTRVYGTGGGQYPYKRVNSNEEARDQAPSESDAQSETVGNGPANSLVKWNGYLQWYPTDEVGSVMDLTTKNCRRLGTSVTECKAEFTFVRPVGYLNFPEGSVQQRIFINPCLTQNLECWDDDIHDPVDPTTGYGTPNDGTELSSAVGSNWSQALQENKWYVGTVRMQWNDEVTPGSYIRTGAGYTLVPAGSPTRWPTYYGGAPSYPQGLASGGDAIIFQMPAAAYCKEHNAGFGSTAVLACDSLTVGGNHAYKKNNDSDISVGDTVWNFSSWPTGCSGHPNYNYIAISTTFNSVSSNFACALDAGEIKSSSPAPVDCETFGGE